MIPIRCAGAVCVLIVSLCAACSSGVNPPDNPGAAETLVGTKWVLGDIVLTFEGPGNGTAAKLLAGGRPGPFMPLDYDVQDGVVTISVLGEQQQGTWDGTTLTMDGVDAVRH
jgi:hypothetical protein